MEILKSLVGKKVRVTNDADAENEFWYDGTLKKVDSKGILLYMGEGDRGKKVNYIKHENYDLIVINEKDQNSEGIFSAFRREQDSFFDE
jgi:hypothetical protein